MIGLLTESRDTKWFYAETIVILRGCHILSADSPAGQNYFYFYLVSGSKVAIVTRYRTCLYRKISSFLMTH